MSNSPQTIKTWLNKRKNDNKTIVEQAHKSSSFLKRIIEGVSRGVSFMASAFSANKNIPVVGFVLQMIATIPESIATITDPKKPLPAKIFSMVVLLAITALSIAAFVVGATGAAIIGLVTASIATVLQGIDFIGKFKKKLDATNRYKHRKEFDSILERGRENPDYIPEGAKFDQDFAIRSVELNHVGDNRLKQIANEQSTKGLQFKYFVDSKIDIISMNPDELKTVERKYTKPPADFLLRKFIALEEEKQNILKEKIFVTKVVQKKNIVISEDDLSGKLRTLYDLYDEQILELAQKISVLNQTPQTSPNPVLLDDILKLMKKICDTDKSINKIVKSTKERKLSHLSGNSNLAKSYTNLALTGAGVIFSVIALLLIIGTVAAPPFVLPVVIGIGVATSAFGIIKWAAEKYAEDEEMLYKTGKEEVLEESILNKAIDCCEYQFRTEHNQHSKCSHSKHMQELLTTSNTAPHPISSSVVRDVSQMNATYESELNDIPHEKDSPIIPKP